MTKQIKAKAAAGNGTAVLSNGHHRLRGLLEAPEPERLKAEPDTFTFDPDEAYNETPLGRGLSAQLMWITPEIAAKYLTMIGKVQRNKKKYHLRSLIEDLNEGRFRLNGETIVFDWDGHMIDGQHRMTIVVETGKPILTVVIRGVAPSSYVTLNNTAKRTGADALKSDGQIHAVTLAAAANILRRYERGMITGMGETSGALSLSPIAVDKTIKEHPGLIESTNASLAAGRVLRAPTVAAFCHYIFSGIDRDAASEFFEKLATGEQLAKGDPILALRNRLRDETFLKDILVFLVFKTWNSWRKGANVMLVRKNDGEALPRPI